MNPPKCAELDYINFQRAAQQVFSSSEAARTYPVEVYHRGLKHFTGLERAPGRLKVAHRTPIGLASRAFARLEVQRLLSGISWFEAKTSIVPSAIPQFSPIRLSILFQLRKSYRWSEPMQLCSAIRFLGPAQQ